jgi:hypothetical protein
VRVARFGPVIRNHLPDFDRQYARLQKRLGALPGPPDTVIHGDLITGNILVDEQARPLAVRPKACRGVPDRRVISGESRSLHGHPTPTVTCKKQITGSAPTNS